MHRKILTGLPRQPEANDLVLNEILFDPKPAASDFVELYNRSGLLVDVSTLYLANRNTAGVIGSIKSLGSASRNFFPGEYLCITEDADQLAKHYLLRKPEAILQVASLPSYPDDAGAVVLLNKQGEIIDELVYNKNWHFKLIANPEGVSLERMNFNAVTQAASSWHSASSTSGYGTPGYKNSQYTGDESGKAVIQVDPKIFSPDNDGRDDIISIKYKFDEPGYVANINIYDAAGRMVRQLVRNELLGREGRWTWDGLNDKALALPVGIYIIRSNLFSLNNKPYRFIVPVVLAK